MAPPSPDPRTLRAGARGAARGGQAPPGAGSELSDLRHRTRSAGPRLRPRPVEGPGGSRPARRLAHGASAGHRPLLAEVTRAGDPALAAACAGDAAGGPPAGNGAA